MTLALPAAPPRTPNRQVLVGTALACAAGAMLIGGMTAVWVLLRERANDAGERFPESYSIPEVASNVMLITILAIPLFAQWTVHAARRSNRGDVGLSLGIVGLMAIAAINAQAFVWVQMGVVISEGVYGPVFYAMTGTMVALIVIGVVFTVVAAFRVLGGRDGDHGIVAGHAMYWYFVAAAFSVVWFVVYVTK